MKLADKLTAELQDNKKILGCKTPNSEKSNGSVTARHKKTKTCFIGYFIQLHHFTELPSSQEANNQNWSRLQKKKLNRKF